MDSSKLKQLLKKIRDREIGVSQAMEQFRTLPFEDLGYAKIDHHRAIRKGLPEVVLAQGKTSGQIQGILERMQSNTAPVLVTRLGEDVYQELELGGADFVYHAEAGILSLNLPLEGSSPAAVSVVSAGTSDHRVALEAVITLRAFDVEPEFIQDVGVAGIHRLFANLEQISASDVIIVVAGMDGALPSVVAGLVNAPVIAVPTSVGYGAGLNGLSALLSMINSCSSGLTVVNVDNGFGAAFSAGLMIRKMYS